MHVRGYKEEGTTTTPFDMVVLNELDRFHLVGDVIDRVPGLGSRAAYAKQYLRDKLLDHKAYIDKHGEDMPEIRNWQWKTGPRNRRFGKPMKTPLILLPRETSAAARNDLRQAAPADYWSLAPEQLLSALQLPRTVSNLQTLSNV